MIYQNVQRGADPELFLINPNGYFVSAIGKIGGTKEEPRPIENYGHGFSVQEDNVAVEFNIPPAKSLEEFRGSIQKMMAYLSEEVAKLNLTLAAVPSARFPESELEDERAFIFGCDPDYNVYTHARNPAPRSEDIFLRSCGGHLHLSWDNPEKLQDRVNMIIAHDLFVGVPSIILDMDDRRRKLYGQAGAFRHKPYGVEYRTCSNFWLSSPQYVDWFYHQSEKAVDFLNNGGKIDSQHYPLIQTTINDINYETLKYLQDLYPIYK